MTDTAPRSHPRRQQLRPRTCQVCDAEFEAGRDDARFCSGKCRTADYRNRQNPDAPKRRRRPLPDQIVGKVWELERVVRRLDEMTTDDRFPGVDHSRLMPDFLGELTDRLTEIRSRFVTED